MIKGKQQLQLTKETILSKIDDYNIYRFYLGYDFDFKKKFKSPFRSTGVDNTPNLCFFPGENGRILFKDFANSKGRGGDCFKFVQELFNLDYNEALIKIDKDFGLGIKTPVSPVFKIQLVEKPDSIHKQSKLIQIEPRKFT